MKGQRRHLDVLIRMLAKTGGIRRRYRADRCSTNVSRDLERAIQKATIQKSGFETQKPGFLKKPGFLQPGFAKPPHSPAAFTLVELLVTITIMSIIAATVLFASAQATQSARRSATRTKINVINSLLMERWNSYTTRRVPLSFSGPNLPKPTNIQTAALRLNAIRSLMIMDMPDRWSEVILLDTVDNKPPWAPINGFKQGIPMPNGEILKRTALSSSYLRHYCNLKTKDLNVIRRYQGAECLYMIIMFGTADGEARSLFRESDIGDVDGDGAPEFIDAWGIPISYVRWPFGFASQSEIITADIYNHDPFDPFRINPTNNGYGSRLLPLIFSAGPDGLYDLVTDSPAGFIYPSSRMPDASGGVYVVDPYADVLEEAVGMADEYDTDNDGRGQNGDGDENWHDNIHNHLKDEK